MSTPARPMIFITHSSRNVGFARRLYNDLKATGFEIWFDDKSLQAGHRLAEEINRGLEWCDVYIPILSAASLASPWCMEEINAAITLSNDPQRVGRPRIIPVLIEHCENQMPALLRARLFIQFGGRYDEALVELKTRGLGMSTQMAAAPTPAPSAYASASLSRMQLTSVPRSVTPPPLRSAMPPPPRAPARAGSSGLPGWAVTAGLIGLIFVLLLLCGVAGFIVLQMLSPAPTPLPLISSTWTPTTYITLTPWATTPSALAPAPVVPTTGTPSSTPTPTYTWTPTPTSTSTWTPTPTPSNTPTCPGPPTITFFAKPDSFEVGNVLTWVESTLSWNVSNATRIVIDQGIGEVPSIDSRVVHPTRTTTYTLIATGCGGTVSKPVTITVKVLPLKPAPITITIPMN